MSIGQAIKATQVKITAVHNETGATIFFNDFITAASFFKIPIAGVYARPKLKEWRISDISYAN